MDIFRFTGPQTEHLHGGELIQQHEKVTWVERYQEAGEVTVETSISSGVREQLPVGSFMSHIHTKEIMRIEDHVISDNGGNEDPTLTITGRTIEAPILENRAAGSNRNFPTPAETLEYKLAEEASHLQALKLIDRHITDPVAVIDDKNLIPYLECVSIVIQTQLPDPTPNEFRMIKPGSLYERLLELLKIDNLGIRTERPSASESNSRLVIHNGIDRSASVIFSLDKGDVVSLEYLESDKKRKNCALLVGRWVQDRILDTSTSGYDRRWMVVDCSDIDQGYSIIPTGFTRAVIMLMMQKRGREALAKQNRIEIVKAEASRDSITAEYRKDYNVGDIVSVMGGYGTKTKMRVSEHVEIYESTGFTAYPTLEVIEKEVS